MLTTQSSQLPWSVCPVVRGDRHRELPTCPEWTSGGINLRNITTVNRIIGTLLSGTPLASQSLCGFRFGQLLSLHLSGMVLVPITIKAPHTDFSRLKLHFFPVGRSGSQYLQGLSVHL